MKSASAILARARKKLLSHEHGVVDIQPELDEFDLLVAQSYLASQLAGAVDVFRGFIPAEPRLYTLETPTLWWQEKETATRFPWIAEASRWLESRGVVTKSDMSGIVQQSEGAARLRWDSIKSVADLSRQLSDSLISGDTVTQFRERIDKATTAVRSQLETGFLTATHQAYIHGKAATLEKPAIKRIFPAVEYFATMDTRTRDWHRVLDGIAVEVDSPAYAIVRRALADFRCRCNVVAIQKNKLSQYHVAREVAELPTSVVEHYASSDLVGV